MIIEKNSVNLWWFKEVFFRQTVNQIKNKTNMQSPWHLNISKMNKEDEF